MALHLLRRTDGGDSSPRAEQPRRAGARARKPATLSHLPPIAAVAVPAGCRAHSETWSLLRLSPGVQQRSRRPRCTPMGPAPKVHEYHDAGFSLPVVVVRARFGLLPRIGRDQFSSGSNVGLASGAESRSALTRSSDGPRPGGARYIPQPSWTVIPSRSDARPRHTLNQALYDRTDRLKVVVHRIAPLFPSSRLRLPGPSVSTSRSLPEGRSPCWSTPTSGRSLPRCRKSHPRARRSAPWLLNPKGSE